MRVLLDENVDRLLKSLFDPEHVVIAVRDRGWTGMANGELLRAANNEFDVLITMDRNLEHQQNLSGLRLSIIVIRALRNAYAFVAPLMPEINAVLRSIGPGQLVYVPG